jgi:hypothetical protein
LFVTLLPNAIVHFPALIAAFVITDGIIGILSLTILLAVVELVVRCVETLGQAIVVAISHRSRTGAGGRGKERDQYYRDNCEAIEVTKLQTHDACLDLFVFRNGLEQPRNPLKQASLSSGFKPSVTALHADHLSG